MLVPEEVVFLIPSSAVTTPPPSPSTRAATSLPLLKVSSILEVAGLNKSMKCIGSDLFGHIYVISLFPSHL